MTPSSPATGVFCPATADRYADLSARLAPVLDSLARGESAREAGRHLPFAAVEELRRAGIGAITVPVDAGGGGAGQEDACRLLMDLAAADANTAHLVRSHLSFVEHLWAQPEPGLRERWLERIIAGDLAGSALAAPRAGAAPDSGGTGATVSQDGGGSLVIRGEKYYTTGSIFSTWTLATVTLDPSVPRALHRRVRGAGLASGHRRQGATPALAVVRVRQPRVVVRDDWDGFGQRLTGTGTLEFRGGAVEDVWAPADPEGTVPLHHANTLLALLAGIGRAALRDGVELMRARRRSANTGGGALPREDEQLLGIVGELSAQQAAVEELVRAAGRDLDQALAALAALDCADGREGGAAEAALERAALTSHRAHALVPRLVLETCTRIFDTLGASATSTEVRLDRHWRNARTIASHDPAVFMARMVGDWEVNRTSPVPYLATGGTDTGHPD